MDIGPLVQAAASKYGVPLLGLVALGQAESGWTRTAERWGNHTEAAKRAMARGESVAAVYAAVQRETPNDLSFGYGQISIGLAAAYGYNVEPIEAILATRHALFDRVTNLDLTARYYAEKYRQASDWHGTRPDLYGDVLMQSLIAYNAGQAQAVDNWYWTAYPQNIANYRAALVWAHEQLDETGSRAT